MPSLTRAEFDVVLVTASWLIGFAPILLFRKRWSWAQCVGLALLASPFVRFALGFYLSVDALFTFTVLQPVSQAAMWSSVQSRLFQDLVVPGVGLLLMHDALPLFGRRRASDALRAEGVAPKRSWRWDALRGLALFFAIAIAYVAAFALSRSAFSILSVNGDESQYWRNLTIPLILLLSGASGLTEELLFRGVLLTRLSKAMPWIAAALVQALFFALIHAGYGTWLHVAGPFAFGLGMAWVARVLGVVAAALLHAEVNVLFFALDVAPTYVAANGALGVVALVALLGAWSFACVVALWVTRADAVRLLWASLRARFAEVPDAGPQVAR